MSRAAILAGGRARRLGGIAKGLVEIDGQPIVARLRAVLEVSAGPVFLVTDDPAPYLRFGLPSVGDRLPGRGAPGGVHAALCHAPPGWVFVAACDLPWLDAATVEALAAARGAHEVALFRAGGYLQPLAAWWHTRALERMEPLLRAGEPSLQALVGALDAVVLDTAETRPFTNLNTPEDVLRASRPG